MTNLRYWFNDKEKVFSDFGKHTLSRKKYHRRRIFIDNKSNILLVAHLDTIQQPRLYRITDKYIYAAGLDDRFGCFIAYYLSRRLCCDLLLTDNEERCRSTAMYHSCKKYNWIAEFDRYGNDVVTYGLDGPGFRQALKQYWNIGFGSFSDICSLDTKSCCVNIGTGVQKDHSKDSYAMIEVTRKQVEKFIAFFREFKDIKFDRVVKYSYQVDGYDYLDCYPGEAGIKNVCEICGSQFAVAIFEHDVCESCFESMYYAKYNIDLNRVV